MLPHIFDQVLAFLEVQQFERVRDRLACRQDVQIGLIDLSHDASERNFAQEIVGQPRRDLYLKGLVDGRTPEIEIGEQNSLVGKLRLCQRKICCGERLALRGGRAGNDQGMERLQCLQMIEACARRVRNSSPGASRGLLGVHYERIRQRIIGDYFGILNDFTEVTQFFGSVETPTESARVSGPDKAAVLGTRFVVSGFCWAAFRSASWTRLILYTLLM